MSSDRELSSKDLQVDFDKILQVHHTDLRQTLNVNALIPLMRQHKLLTVEECQEIKSKPSDSEKIDQLVHILPRKGKLACRMFIKCLESEQEHLGHPELVLKLKGTIAKLNSQQAQPLQSVDTAMDTESGKTKQKTVVQPATLVAQFSDSLMLAFNERDNRIKDLEKRMATLKTQLQQKDKQISDLQSHASHTQFYAVTEVAKFHQLLDYVNGGHGSQLSSKYYDTRTIAGYYHELKSIMNRAKQCLEKDAEYVRHCINATSEESDGIHSRTSSFDSENQLEESAGESYSSADETDDEILDTKLEPEREQEIVFRLKSQRPQRPESWMAYKERRTSKAVSRYSVNSSTLSRKGSTTDSDANDDKKEVAATFDVAAVKEEVEQQNVDINLACSNVELSSIDDQEEPSSIVLAGYLHKEGTAPHDRWKKRYFTLTKEYLYYSKSPQDPRPINGFPLIGLALERKKKNSFEVINTQAANIKVDKPGKRQIANFRVIKLKAHSETEALKWMESIDDAIKKLRTQYIHA